MSAAIDNRPWYFLGEAVDGELLERAVRIAAEHALFDDVTVCITASDDPDGPLRRLTESEVNEMARLGLVLSDWNDDWMSVEMVLFPALFLEMEL